MSPEELDQVLRRLGRLRPFRPFHIEFGSGDRLLVRHPEAVIRWGGLHVHASPGGEHRLFSATLVTQVVLPARV